MVATYAQANKTAHQDVPAEEPVTAREYVRTLYDTGHVSPDRPQFGDLEKHIVNIETFAKGAPGNLPLIQNRIKRNPTLATLLENVSSAGGKGEQTEEDKRFITSKDGKRLIKLHSVEDIYSLPDPVYLITKTLESISLSLLYGMSGTGKTFSALHVALCIAHGIQWMGRRVKQGPAWYINTEGGRALKKRLKAWYIEHSSLSPTTNFKIIPWSLDLRDNFQDLIDTIEAMSEDEKPSLIIFDNFSMCTAGINQNLQEEVAPILRKLNGLAQECECHVMMLHHTNKEDDVNGTMAFRNHVDTMIQLKKEDKQDKQSPILFCCQKARDDEPFSDIKTELKQVALYTETDSLETITSCVVVESEAPLKVEGLKPTAQNILDILDTRSLLHSEWQKECTGQLKIASVTFDRNRDTLIKKGYVVKYKPDGQKVDHYKKAELSTSTLQGVGVVNE